MTDAVIVPRATARRRVVLGGMVACGLLLSFACTARGDAHASGTGASAQDSLHAASPPGEPASSFPAPSRRVADIVAPRWSDEHSRDDAGEFSAVARLAGIRDGMHVADIGAGDGYYVSRLSPLVGARGRVFGNDIITDYLRLLQARVRSDRLTNVQVVRGDPHDPRLPPADIDIALMIHMYHEIEQPFALLWNLATAMKPGGRLVILDLERQTTNHGTPPALLRCELKAVGYRERAFTRTGREEYVAMFDAPKLADRPTPAAVRQRLLATPCRA
jgi:SAM-dependent methyltransferase